MMSTNLSSAKLIFEPSPPPQVIPNHVTYGSPTIRRRVQSAKEGRSNHWRAQDKIKERPSSAVPASEKQSPCSRLTSKPPSGRPGRFLARLELDKRTTQEGKPASRTQKSSRLPVSHEPRTVKSEVSVSTDKHEQEDVEIPSGISELAPWLTPNINQRLIGVDPSSCLVFLPTLVGCDDLPVVPPVQTSKDLLRYTSVKEEEKQFDPRKLFHYNVLKNRPHSADHVCNHRWKRTHVDIQKIYGSDGQLLYDERNYHGNRTKELIQKEIEDLEKLLQGIGSGDSDNIIVRYQHDINILQKTVKETLSRYNRSPKSMEPSEDLTGLRAYLKEKEKIIQRIRERRKKCVEELQRLDGDFGIKVTITTHLSKT